MIKNMNRIGTKRVSLIFIKVFILIVSTTLNAQKATDGSVILSTSIEACYEWSRENYPQLKQMEMIDKTTQFNLSNASNGNLPQINIHGQASYQSEVTQLPIEVPNMEIPAIDKDQYTIYGSIYQPLTHFSEVKVNKKLIESNSQIEKQKVEVALYQLKERINQIYFGALLIDEKMEQLKIIQSDLANTLLKIEAAISNGTATFTDKQLLVVEQISLNQQIDEQRSNKLAFLQMLSTFTGKNITKNTTLEKPQIVTISDTIKRPELALFNLQNQAVELQIKHVQNHLIPSVGLFLQGGYGRPALNFLKNEFEFYYIGGIKLHWNLTKLYNIKNSKEALRLSNEKIASQRATFLLNTNLTQTQQSAEIDKFKTLIKSDKVIIKIRKEVLETAKVKLENGLITTLDYVQYLNDLNKASQTLLLHETQLLLAQYNLKTTTGN